MRRSIAAVCLVAVASLPACSGNEPPNSLFDSSGYHVRGDKVYYLTAFPGAASEIAGADAVSFKAFDTTYAKDKYNAYFEGQPITGNIRRVTGATSTACTRRRPSRHLRPWP